MTNFVDRMKSLTNTIKDATKNSANEFYDDCPDIDTFEFEGGNNLIEISKLHGKYFRAFIDAEEQVDLAQAEYDLALRDITLFYTKNDRKIDEERMDAYDFDLELKELTILKTEIDRFIKADPNYVAVTLYLAATKRHRDMLQDNIKQLKDRGFQMNSAVTFMKFKSGG